MNITLFTQCRSLKLPLHEKSVLLVLASYAKRGSNEAHPSVATLAANTGMGTTKTRATLRELQRRSLICPTGSTKGGPGNSTAYTVQPNAGVLAYSENNPTQLEPQPNGGQTLTQQRGVDSGLYMAKAVVKTTTTAPTQEEMEAITSVFNHYLDAFDKDESLTPSRLKIGLMRLREYKEGFPMSTYVNSMCNAIDTAKEIAHKPKKQYFENWHCIFGKRGCFRSLLDQHHEESSGE